MISWLQWGKEVGMYKIFKHCLITLSDESLWSSSICTKWLASLLQNYSADQICQSLIRTKHSFSINESMQPIYSLLFTLLPSCLITFWGSAGMPQMWQGELQSRLFGIRVCKFWNRTSRWGLWSCLPRTLWFKKMCIAINILSVDFFWTVHVHFLPVKPSMSHNGTFTSSQKCSVCWCPRAEHLITVTMESSRTKKSAFSSSLKADLRSKTIILNS